MTDNKRIDYGYQPLEKRGYQAKPNPPPGRKKVQGGYQPASGEASPLKPPPKKP
ncbi:MAG: hypothetical protein AB7E78_14970 [Porticoccaceae bacterium]